MITDGPALTRLASFINGYPFKPEDLGEHGVPVVRIRQLIDTDAPADYADPPARAVWINTGDLVLAWSGTLAVRLWTRGPALLNQHLFRVDPAPGVVPRWLAYVLEEGVLRLKPYMHGSAMTHITRPMLKHVTAWLPPVEEQQRFADYLDTETARIDELIAEQERSENLLAEYREALITQVVTGSATRSTTWRDSGVPWIGQIPSHWTVQRLKTVGRATIGLTYDPSDVVSDPSEGTLVLRAGNVQSERIVLGDNVYVTTRVPDNLRLRPGDILICARNGSARLIGKSALIPDSLGGATWGAFMTVFRTPSSRYIAWVLRSSLFSQQLGLFTTSTINQLTVSILHNLQVPIPPLDEQGAIAARLDEEVGRLDELAEELRVGSSLAREHRQALITHAVTQGIDGLPGVA